MLLKAFINQSEFKTDYSDEHANYFHFSLASLMGLIRLLAYLSRAVDLS